MSAEIDGLLRWMRPSLSTLQWGRAPMSAEISHYSVDHPVARRTSMGRRSDQRGIRQPRQIHQQLRTLQWGRAPMSAEIRLR